MRLTYAACLAAIRTRRWMRGTLLVAAACAAVVACSCTDAPEGPDVVVLRWVHAFAASDGTTMAQLTCRASQSDVQNARLLTMALGTAPPTFGGAGGGQFFGGGGGGQPSYDVSNLQYATRFTDGESARVQITGVLRITSGMTSQSLATNGNVPLVRERKEWRVCDSAA